MLDHTNLTKGAAGWLDLYKEICVNIRETDAISFKLLAFVPSVSGIAAGTLTFLKLSEASSNMTSWIVLAIALIGFGMTFGLFRWEMRNVEKCLWLIERAADVEKFTLAGGAMPTSIQYLDWKKYSMPAAHWHSRWGKRESETCVYGCALAAWLLPAVVALVTLLPAMDRVAP